MEISSNQSPTQQGSESGAPIGSGLANDLRNQAGEITEQAKVKAKEAAHSGQTMAADQLHHLAEGVRRSVDNFDEEQAWIKQGLSTAAESLDRFSATLRERDLEDLMHDAEDTARRHPVVFATACAVAGFALVRFLKSSQSDGAGSRDSGVAGYRRRSVYGERSGMARTNASGSADNAANI